ncbi:hypothetical protein Tco_0885629 [Tanacetum coccineum]
MTQDLLSIAVLNSIPGRDVDCRYFIELWLTNYLTDTSTKSVKGTMGDASMLKPTLMAFVPAILDRVEEKGDAWEVEKLLWDAITFKKILAPIGQGYGLTETCAGDTYLNARFFLNQVVGDKIKKWQLLKGENGLDVELALECTMRHRNKDAYIKSTGQARDPKLRIGQKKLSCLWRVGWWCVDPGVAAANDDSSIELDVIVNNVIVN